ncbi:hypothetical protein [Gordonia malaquae]|uniref:hypothetical protein n=1 Tax=Gordonia malaquae TaxID=410332 RepID=UPI0030FEA896
MASPFVLHDGPLGLLAMILRDAPDLRGASCAGLGPLYDPDVPAEALGYPTREARRAAVEDLCVGCPVRARCWQWSSSIGENRVTGPTASTASLAGALWPRRRRNQ